MASSTSPSQALCLLLVVIVAIVGAACAETNNNNNNDNNNKIQPTVPGSCLMAASTLCANADTNAMRCLRKLAITGDARVPTTCAEALMAGMDINPRRNQAARTTRLTRMLTEGGGCVTGNNCPSSFANVNHNQCNDVLSGCSCGGGAYTVTKAAGNFAVVLSANPSNLNCNNICCKGFNNAAACCLSYTSGAQGSKEFVWCIGVNANLCQLT